MLKDITAAVVVFGVAMHFGSELATSVLLGTSMFLHMRAVHWIGFCLASLSEMGREIVYLSLKDNPHLRARMTPSQVEVFKQEIEDAERGRRG